MDSLNDINVKKRLWDKKMLDSRLELNIAGKNINHTIINTLRRMGTFSVPIYAFTKIIINENTSIFNGNYLKLRLNNLPVIGIKTEDHIFEDKIVEENVKEELDISNIDDLNMEVNQDINSSTLEQLTMYLEFNNESDNIVSVGTDNSVFYYKSKKLNKLYPVNIPIVKLQPKQKIKLSAITSLNIEKKSAIYSPVSIFTFKKNNDTDYDLIIESRSQLSEIEILDIVNSNTLKVLEDFIKLVPTISDKEGSMVLKNTDHTIGNIISEGLQNHKDIIFAGYKMPHPLGDEIIINFKLERNNILSVCKDVVKYYKDVFTLLNKNIQKIN